MCIASHTLSLICGVGGTGQNEKTLLPTSDRTFFTHSLNGCFLHLLLWPVTLYNSYVHVNFKYIVIAIFCELRQQYQRSIPALIVLMLSLSVILQLHSLVSNNVRVVASIEWASGTSVWILWFYLIWCCLSHSHDHPGLESTYMHSHVSVKFTNWGSTNITLKLRSDHRRICADGHVSPRFFHPFRQCCQTICVCHESESLHTQWKT